MTCSWPSKISYGAVLLDRLWNVRRMNAGAQRLLLAFLDPRLVPLPVATNLVRASLHPDGLRSHIVNFPEVAALLLERLERSHHAHPEDAERHALPAGGARLSRSRPLDGDAAVGGGAGGGFRLGAGQLKLFSMLTTWYAAGCHGRRSQPSSPSSRPMRRPERWFQQRRAMDRALSQLGSSAVPRRRPQRRYSTLPSLHSDSLAWS